MTQGGKQKLLLLALVATAFLSWEVGKLAAQTWQKVVPSGGGSNWQCTGQWGLVEAVCVNVSTGEKCYSLYTTQGYINGLVLPPPAGRGRNSGITEPCLMKTMADFSLSCRTIF